MGQMADDDLALLDRWCGGDAAAGNALFRRNFEAVYRFFDHKLDRDADDLVQETFLACLRGRDRFRRHSSFRTYLFAIARNLLYRYWRDRGGLPSTVDLEHTSLAALSTSIGTQLIRREDRARLLDALVALPLDQQLLLELHYWEELDAEQLAEVFDTAPATSRSRLFRAREALRERLSGEDAGANPGREGLEAWARALLQAHTAAAPHDGEPPEGGT
jgi:RNA polymerase sigma-70 factor (ECF subfamily)